VYLYGRALQFCVRPGLPILMSAATMDKDDFVMPWNEIKLLSLNYLPLTFVAIFLARKCINRYINKFEHNCNIIIERIAAASADECSELLAEIVASSVKTFGGESYKAYILANIPGLLVFGGKGRVKRFEACKELIKKAINKRLIELETGCPGKEDVEKINLAYGKSSMLKPIITGLAILLLLKAGVNDDKTSANFKPFSIAIQKFRTAVTCNNFESVFSEVLKEKCPATNSEQSNLNKELKLARSMDQYAKEFGITTLNDFTGCANDEEKQKLVNKVYRQLTLKTHPDKVGKQYEEVFKAISNINEDLSKHLSRQNTPQTCDLDDCNAEELVNIFNLKLISAARYIAFPTEERLANLRWCVEVMEEVDKRVQSL